MMRCKSRRAQTQAESAVQRRVPTLCLFLLAATDAVACRHKSAALVDEHRSVAGSDVDGSNGRESCVRSSETLDAQMT